MDKRLLYALLLGEQYGLPPMRPLQGDERRDNGDGSYSTELTMTSDAPEGGYMVHPSLWMDEGQPVELPPDLAMQAADNYEKWGPQFPRFDDLDASEEWAIARSKGGGANISPLARKR